MTKHDRTLGQLVLVSQQQAQKLGSLITKLEEGLTLDSVKMTA